MCQIITKNIRSDKLLEFMTSDDINTIEDQLSIKGGLKGGDEGYSCWVSSFFCIRKKRFFELKQAVLKHIDLLNDSLLEANKIVQVVFFSRQRPEMENDIVEISPYFNKNNASWYWVHGTISNDKELVSILHDVKLTVDTQLFEYLTPELFDKLEGLYSYIEIDKDDNIKMIDKGMGKYITYDFEKDNPIEFSTTDLSKPNQALVDKTIRKYKIAFSAGMDITLTTFKILSDILKIVPEEDISDVNIELVLFKYGTHAENIEYTSALKFIEYIKGNGFNDLNISLSQKDITPLMSNIQQVTGEVSKLTTNSTADEKETESNLAYVPYRNTLFCTLLNAAIQKQYHKRKEPVGIGFGLNLSEGQVYGDNNIAWLNSTESMLSYGGKFFQDVKIVSPYINKTKINMLKLFELEFGKDVLTDLLDISFSCYYPKDGKSCNECGSCILRQKAIQMAKGDANGR